MLVRISSRVSAFSSFRGIGFLLPHRFLPSVSILLQPFSPFSPLPFYSLATHTYLKTSPTLTVGNLSLLHYLTPSSCPLHKCLGFSRRQPAAINACERRSSSSPPSHDWRTGFFRHRGLGWPLHPCRYGQDVLQDPGSPIQLRDELNCERCIP